MKKITVLLLMMAMLIITLSLIGCTKDTSANHTSQQDGILDSVNVRIIESSAVFSCLETSNATVEHTKDGTMIDFIIKIINIIQAISVIGGVIIALISLFLDHKRRRCQTTLEVYIEVSEQTIRWRNKITDIFSNQIIDPNDSRYIEDKELQSTIIHFLSLCEQISVGINFNVLDLRVFMRIAGKTYIGWYERLKPVIEKLRKEDRPTICRDFEKLVNEMVEKYEKHPKKYMPQ